MNSVTITGPGTVTGSAQWDGRTWYAWTFPVVVNGQAGTYTIYVYTDDPGKEQWIEGILIETLENLPEDDVDLGGIAENDPGTDTGDFITVGDDDDTAVASNGGDDSGDSA